MLLGTGARLDDDESLGDEDSVALDDGVFDGLGDVEGVMLAEPVADIVEVIVPVRDGVVDDETYIEARGG